MPLRLWSRTASLHLTSTVATLTPTSHMLTSWWVVRLGQAGQMGKLQRRRKGTGKGGANHPDNGSEQLHLGRAGGKEQLRQVGAPAS